MPIVSEYGKLIGQYWSPVRSLGVTIGTVPSTTLAPFDRAGRSIELTSAFETNVANQRSSIFMGPMDGLK